MSVDCRVHLVTTKVRVVAEIDVPGELTSGRHMSELRKHMEDALIKYVDDTLPVLKWYPN